MHFIPHPDDAPSPVPDRHIATMATLNLGLPDDLLAYLDEQAFAHGHDDSAQYVVEVLHQHRERQALKSRLINSITSSSLKYWSSAWPTGSSFKSALRPPSGPDAGQRP